MATILDKIAAYKRDEVAKAKTQLSLSALEAQAKAAPPVRGFAKALDARAAAGQWGLIAEIKKASPSKGLIRADFDPPALAKAYQKGGAACLSVLTDGPSFQGKPEYLTQARDAVSLPVLRKDFIIHEAQIYEAVVAGADAILLIVAALDQATLVHLLNVAHSFQLEVLMEVHDLAEMDRALETDVRIIGVNNRNLKSFVVDLATTENLAEEVPHDIILVSESGIKTVADAQRVADCGADALLVGETLMRSGNVLVDLPALMVEKPV
jgi:indole-3-glycerol phosphate synthase